MGRKELIEKIKLNPAGYFDEPSEVNRDQNLNDRERLEILSAWERDAHALSVAADESMTGGEPSKLQEVVEARLKAEEAVAKPNALSGLRQFVTAVTGLEL